MVYITSYQKPQDWAMLTIDTKSPVIACGRSQWREEVMTLISALCMRAHVTSTAHSGKHMVKINDNLFKKLHLTACIIML